MSNFLEFLPNGRIVTQGCCPPDDILKQCACNGGFIKTFNKDTIICSGTQYIHPTTEALLNRPDNGAVISSNIIKPNGVDEVTISNLLNPSTVTLDSTLTNPESDEVVDGEYIFSVPEVGVYEIVVKSFPQQTKRFTVTAYEESGPTD